MKMVYIFAVIAVLLAASFCFCLGMALYSLSNTEIPKHVKEQGGRLPGAAGKS